MDGDDERRYIVGIIQDGAKSDYWKLLKQSISEWIAEENKRLDSYKDSAITEKDIEKYNRAVDRIRYLKRMLAMTAFSMSYDQTRYVLNGSLFVFGPKTLKIVATDGRSLAMIEKKKKPPKKI